jgi:putative redox protein
MSLNEIIDGTATAVGADPTLAAARFQASAAWSGGVASTITTRQHVFTVDEPPTLGGTDTAANPVEYALAALISCQVVTYRFWAARLGIAVDEITIEAEGDLDVRGFFGLDSGVRPGFTAVRLEAVVVGPESPERYQELQEAVDGHCPVLDLFGNDTPVSTKLRVGTPA